MGSRPGIFTETQREYLRGEYDGTEDAENHLRADIRKSILQTFEDLALAAKSLGDEDMDLIAWQPKVSPSGSPSAFRHQPAGFPVGQFPPAIGLFYRCYPNPSVFAKYVEMGVEQGLEQEGYKSHVNATIDIGEPTHKSEIRETLESDGVEAITNGDITFLQRCGELSTQEANDLRAQKHKSMDTERRRMRRGSDQEAIEAANEE